MLESLAKILPALFAFTASLVYAGESGTPSAVLVGSAKTQAKASNAAGLNADYNAKMRLPTACGNRTYLMQISDNYRNACDQVAVKQREAIRSKGKVCGHVAMVSPAIRGTDVSQVMCVVRGGDIVYGMTTNTINYLVTSTGVERLPVDTRGSRAAVDSAVSRAMEGQTKTLTVYLVKAWKWRHNAQRPHMIQVIPVESQRVCDALLDAGDSGSGFSGDIAEMFCMRERPSVPAEWQCQGSIEPSGGDPVTYICDAT